MSRKTLVYFLILLATPQFTFAQKAVTAQRSNKESLVEEAVFHSGSLNRDMHYLVLLPHDYDSGRSFAVLYLLHGLYGDYKNWDTKTGIERYAKTLSLIIVMPDADDSWYTNSVTVPHDRFEDYIAKDLIYEIDTKYRTIREGQARGIAGLSMGGYGAVKLALRHPGLFAFSASLSGALNAPRDLDRERPEFRAKLLEVFGDPGNSVREQNDVFMLLRNVHDYPYFYLACGAADSFLSTNRAFTAQLSAQKAPYEFHETPGGHTWEYWDSTLSAVLQAASQHLNLGAPPGRE